MRKAAKLLWKSLKELRTGLGVAAWCTMDSANIPGAKDRLIPHALHTELVLLNWPRWGTIAADIQVDMSPDRYECCKQKNSSKTTDGALGS